MRTYDITLTVSPSMPVWPGDPKVSIQRVQKIEEGSIANVSRMEMSVHTGTHVDAPYHFLKEGSTTERLSLKVLIGRAYVVHLDDNVDRVLPSHLEEAGIPPRTRRVLIRTRNSKQWAKSEYRAFEEEYVGVDVSAAQYLVKRGVKLVGVDYLSVAPFPEPAPTHLVLLKAGVVIVEGLNLSQVAQGRYNFFCLPLKLEKSDGAPARAVLMGV